MTKAVNLSSVDEVYKHFKKGNATKYSEENHCKLLIKIMTDKEKGRVSSFCTEAMISEKCFYNWVNTHPLFGELYYYCNTVAKEIWEKAGEEIRNSEYQMGTINYSFEYWKLIGWSRFGISKNSRLKLNLNHKSSPLEHYQSILKQASDGDFTASEFKQLMEAVNVGLNLHQIYELQKQIDELKSDLVIMAANTNVQNPFTDKGTKE